MSDNKDKRERKASTLAALLEEKPKRGRPPRAVSRQTVYVALSQTQKDRLGELASLLPQGLSRADLPDLAISILSTRFEALRRAVADRDREIPEGVTDLESLYLLWDLSLPTDDPDIKWTSIRVSPQQVIDLGRVHGILNAVFNANRSKTFDLALMLLSQFLHDGNIYDPGEPSTLSELRKKLRAIYL
ncbi:MAG: hypothetical protein H6667_11290 [Ardenticatenaceae bacterium]|nr:hypothetical protein [Ardenticatenaceae bacterium]